MRRPFRDRGGGLVVSVLALYSDDPSLNPTEVYNFSVKLLLKRMKIKQKEAGVGPFKKNNYTNWSWLCGSVGRVVASDTRGPRFY